MSADSPVYILDSYALLAYLGGELGGERVKALLREAEQGNCRICISWINLGEVVYITERDQGLPKAHAVLAMVEQLPLELLEASREAVLGAAHVKALHSLSYADAFAVAAAQELGAIVVTGDAEFRAVTELIQVEWL